MKRKAIDEKYKDDIKELYEGNLKKNKSKSKKDDEKSNDNDNKKDQ